MGSTSFRLRLVLRVLALHANAFVLVWGLVATDWQVTPFVSATLLVLQTLELIHYLEATNRHFTAFVDSIAAQDFSTRYHLGAKGATFRLLGDAFNRITASMQRMNSDRAAQHQLLETLIEHIGTALLCIDANGRITLMNRAAKRLFNFPHLNHALALGKADEKLPALLRDAQPGESRLITLTLDGQPLPLSMFTTRFELLGHTYSLVSFQNIRDELESRELDSWQKLIKVLTHEIMNSVTPIVSLSAVIKEALLTSDQQLRLGSLTADERQDLVRSLLAIEERGKGLMHFVQSYNNLANVPKPYFTDVALAALLERLALLLHHDMEQAGIAFTLRCEPDTLCVRADVQQLEQVLINLVKNAKEAIGTRSNGHIAITASKAANGEVRVCVSDNGDGIAEDKLDDIFIPFYTSKKDGSGIGLSISRQLMLANKGHLSVQSQPGLGSEFTLVFRAAT